MCQSSGTLSKDFIVLNTVQLEILTNILRQIKECEGGIPQNLWCARCAGLGRRWTELEIRFHNRNVLLIENYNASRSATPKIDFSDPDITGGIYGNE